VVIKIADLMETKKYVAFLRGINVGGHHKVPMAVLKELFLKSGFGEVKTLLNSGNVVFSGPDEELQAIENRLAGRMAEAFGFPVPVLVRTSDDIRKYIETDPFNGVVMNRNIKLYITLLSEVPAKIPKQPFTSSDTSFVILNITEDAVFSVLDVAKSQTVDAMSVLGKFFGEDITTRNWNTIIEISGLLGIEKQVAT
jgi:uncharacterized protein (DUF1697 family)